MLLAFRQLHFLIIRDGPKELYIFEKAISLEPFKTWLNGFHQNVSSVSENKYSVANLSKTCLILALKENVIYLGSA